MPCKAAPRSYTTASHTAARLASGATPASACGTFACGTRRRSTQLYVPHRGVHRRLLRGVRQLLDGRRRDKCRNMTIARQAARRRRWRPQLRVLQPRPDQAGRKDAWGRYIVVTRALFRDKARRTQRGIDKFDRAALDKVVGVRPEMQDTQKRQRLKVSGTTVLQHKVSG